MKRFMHCLLPIVVGIGLWTMVLISSQPCRAPAVIAVRTIADPVIADPVIAEPFREVEPVRQAAEGLPVPIYPGTRVTEAELGPPRASLPPGGKFRRVPDPHPPLVPAASRPARLTTQHTIAGRLSATEQRARDDARTQLEREAADWLAPEIPPSWKVPPHLLNSLVVETRVKPIVKDYGTVYEATQRVDFSPAHRDEIRAAYQSDLVRHRLLTLGGVFGFLLACLAALSGYIRADEATKGYYTTWLRTIAAGGVGAAGVVIYELLA